MKNLENVKIIQRNLKNDPIVLIDVGARGGIDLKWKGILGLIKVFAFEPDEKETLLLKKNNNYKFVTYFPYALGDENCMHKTLYICRQPGCSSFLRPNTSYVEKFYYGPSMEVVSMANINVVRLDKFCSENKILVDFIKIDAQGWELKVLDGSHSLFPKIKMIEIEVGFNSQYVGQPLFSDVDKYLRKKGFALLGLKRSYWRRRVRGKYKLTPYGGTLMHGDALYYNESLLMENATERDIVILCILLSAFKQDDFITHLLMTPHKVIKIIPETLRWDLLQRLLTEKPIGSKILSKILYKIQSRTLRRFAIHLRPPSVEDWHDSEFF